MIPLLDRKFLIADLELGIRVSVLKLVVDLLHLLFDLLHKAQVLFFRFSCCTGILRSRCLVHIGSL